MLRRLAAVSLVALVLPQSVWACSYAGPNPDAFYASLSRPAYLIWGISAAAAASWLIIGRRHPRFGFLAFVLIGLTAIQPAWWVRADLGDCGGMRNGTATIVAAVGVLIVVAGLLRLRAITNNGAVSPGV